jgi:hypothetical protein
MTLSSIVRTFDLRHVGECPTCMRISFMAMSLAALATIASSLLGLNTALFAMLAVGLALLWLAHIVTRAIRSARRHHQADPSRRLAIRTFAQVAVGAAAMSAIPWGAHADSGCGGWAGNSGCRPCASSCQRQRNDCSCYSCRSCGNNCGNAAC